MILMHHLKGAIILQINISFYIIKIRYIIMRIMGWKCKLDLGIIGIELLLSFFWIIRNVCFCKWNYWKVLRFRNDSICIIFYKYRFVHPHLFVLISLIFIIAVVLDEKLDHRDIVVGNWISSVRFFLISFIIQLDCCCNDDYISVSLEWGFQQCLDKEENCRPWISWNVTWAHDGPEIFLVFFYFFNSFISIFTIFSFCIFIHTYIL